MINAPANMVQAERLDLNNSVVRVAVNRGYPYCDFSDKLEMLPSVELNHLKVLAKQFNFQIELIDAKGDYGNLVNATWTGLVGLVHSKKAHLGLCSLSVTEQRLQAVDFTHFTAMEKYKMLSYMSQPESRLWISTVPFTVHVWAMLLVCLVGLSAIHQTHHRIQCEPWAYAHTVWQYCRISLRQKITIKPQRSRVSGLLLMTWMMSSCVLTLAYVSVFHSILTVSKYEAPLDTVHQLQVMASKDQVVIRIMGKTFLSNLLNTTLNDHHENKLFDVMSANIQRSHMPFLTNSRERTLEILRWNASIRPVFIMPDFKTTLLQIISNGHRKLHISEEHLFLSYDAICLPKASPWTSPFNHVIQHLEEGGFRYYWTKQMSNSFSRNLQANRINVIESIFRVNLPELGEPRVSGRPESVNTLNLQDLQSIFFLLLIGLSISFVVLIAEIIILIVNIVCLV